MLRAVIHLIHRELLMALRQRADIFNPLWFFLIVITLFPLGIGPEPQLLARIAPGIIWVAALLAAMLSLERLFRDDFSDGALEQMMLMPHPLGLLALAKVIAHWLLTGLPLLLVSPLLAILLSLELKTYLAVVATLALGTPVLSLLGAVGVALTAGLRKGGRAAQPAAAAALYSGAYLRHVRHRRGEHGTALCRSARHPGGHAGGGIDPDPPGHLGGAAGECQLIDLAKRFSFEALLGAR